MDLAWGPNWSGSLKSLWLGDGEAIGDIVVGEELAEHLGAEPMHPVLMDLCTGVAFPAFPALLAAEQGVSDLFLPLRYGQVMLAEKMPRRFYCRARWHRSELSSETQVFDLDFVDRGGRPLGGIREFTVKRAPREALLRGLGGDATRLLYTVGWHEVPPTPKDDAASTTGTWLIAGFDELAAKVPGCIPFDRAAGHESLGRLLIQAREAGVPFSGVVWRGTAPAADESTTAAVTRLEAELADLLSAVHAVQGGSENCTVTLPNGLWMVTERAVATESGEPVDPVQAALWGFGRTTINEEPALGCKLVDCDASPEAVDALADLLVAPVAEPELALRQGKLLASRLLPWARSGHLTVPRSADYVLAPTERGAIDNLRLTEINVPPPADGYVQVRVEAAGLNFRDVLNVLGLYPGDPGPIGGDFAGVVTQLGGAVTGLEVGQRVYGFMQGAFASRFNVPAQLLAPIPDGVSAVEAATIPAAALTVRLAFDWAQLKSGDRVLIHAASGGVGLAAIQMAQQCGATVFATASTFKRATLRKMGVKYVYDSRTTDFADQILADTGGAGVDVVLNSLTSEGFLEATVRATAQNGRFLEIAKRDIWTPEQMAAARPDIAYEIVALDTVTLQEPERIRSLLTEVSEGLAAAVDSSRKRSSVAKWVPLPAEIYPLTEARAAFRRMQQARHIGKIVCQVPNPLQPRADRSYLITGGLGAIGLHTAAYLAQLGAGDIVLTSRRAPDADARRVIGEITERSKSRIHVFAADVGDESEVATLLERIRADLPPLAGVAHLAGVLDDALLSQQSVERFRTTLAAKAFGACHLDRLTKQDQLDFFIVSSSVSALFGSPGQANYATANALLDGLVAQRRANGLPATGVNFGPWAEGGMASSEAAVANIGAQGLIPLAPSAALSALSEVVANGTGQATVIKANWQRAAKVLGSSRPPILDLVLPSAVGEVTGDSELLKQLQEIPVPQRAGFVTEFLQREVQNFLRLASPPAATSRFLDLGTDSLMAIELRNRLHSQFGGAFTINATAVFDYPTIGGLAEYLVGQLGDAEPTASDAPPSAPSDAAEVGTGGRGLLGPARRFDRGRQGRVQRHVEAVVDARLLGGQPFDGSQQPIRGRGVAAVRPGASWDVGAADDGELRVSVDEDAVVPDALVRLRPLRRAGRVDARDVVDDDALPAARPADDLQPERALGALFEVTHHVLHRLLQWETLDDLGDVVDLEAQPPADQPDVAAPHHRRDRRQQHHRNLVHRSPEAAADPHRIGLVVGRVVEDLLAVDRLDAGAQTGGHHRERVIGPARVHPTDQQRGAASLGGGGQAVDPFPWRRPRVVEGVERRRDDVSARAKAPLDVVHGLLGSDVARRHVGHRVAVLQRGVGVQPWPGRPCRCRAPANVAASRPALAADEVITPTSSSPGNAMVDRIAVDPMLPVPHTTTRLIRPTLAGCWAASWQTSHLAELPAQR